MSAKLPQSLAFGGEDMLAAHYQSYWLFFYAFTSAGRKCGWVLRQ
jgi:hypothetical protein